MESLKDIEVNGEKVQRMSILLFLLFSQVICVIHFLQSLPFYSELLAFICFD
jgi:hypothetical protein